jgi:hypothetical protein
MPCFMSDRFGSLQRHKTQLRLMEENRLEILARQRGIRQKRNDGGVSKTLAAFIRSADEGPEGVRAPGRNGGICGRSDSGASSERCRTAQYRSCLSFAFPEAVPQDSSHTGPEPVLNHALESVPNTLKTRIPSAVCSSAPDGTLAFCITSASPNVSAICTLEGYRPLPRPGRGL